MTLTFASTEVCLRHLPQRAAGPHINRARVRTPPDSTAPSTARHRVWSAMDEGRGGSRGGRRRAVGATAAGELTLGRYGGSPDAILAALLLIEMSARFGGKLRALIDDAKGKV